MKHLKHYASILAILMLLLQLTFTSCSEGEDVLIANGGNTVYLVNVISREGGTATTSSSQVISGCEVTLTAIPESTYRFVNWTVEDEEVSKLNPYTTIVTNDITYVANFEKNDPQYVDLGLSVKWATFNVGAKSPEEYGDYFAWGETLPMDLNKIKEAKIKYDWTNYKYCKGTYDTMTKYCTDSQYGTIDNITVLELSDDAAHVNWGGTWRMPTKAEQDELRDNSTWTWTTQNGVNGYKVTSKKNGNSIFLPAAGYITIDELRRINEYGSYWSSSLYTSGGLTAYYLFFDSDIADWHSNYRRNGRTIRPVCP